jgi:hypothetical protein
MDITAFEKPLSVKQPSSKKNKGLNFNVLDVCLEGARLESGLDQWLSTEGISAFCKPRQVAG